MHRAMCVEDGLDANNDDNVDAQGGIHIYHLLSTYIASWPTLLFSLLTVILFTDFFGGGLGRSLRTGIWSFMIDPGCGRTWLPWRWLPDARPERHEQVPSLALGSSAPLRHLLFNSPNRTHGEKHKI